MPAQRMLACLSKPGLTGRERAVLAVLAYHDGRGGCWPSDDTIARGAGVRHRSAVVEARKGLQRKGWLRWTHGQHVNRYEIAYGEPFAFGSHRPGDVAVEDGGNGPLSGERDTAGGGNGPLSGERDTAGGASTGDRGTPLSGKRDGAGGGNGPLSGERDTAGGASTGDRGTPLSGKRDGGDGASAGAGPVDGQLGLALHGGEPAGEPPPAAPRPPERGASLSGKRDGAGGASAGDRGPPLSGERDSAGPSAGDGVDNPVDNQWKSCAERDGGDAPLSGKRGAPLSGKRDTNWTLTGKSKSTAGASEWERGGTLPAHLFDRLPAPIRDRILRAREDAGAADPGAAAPDPPRS